MTNKSDKAVFASLQHSRATILKLKEVSDRREKGWIDEFLDVVSKKPEVLVESLADFEKAVAKASDAIALANNVRFMEAIADFRDDLLDYGTDNFNLKHYKEILKIVLRLFDRELAFAQARYKEQKYLSEIVDIKYVAKAAQILEEARITEFMEEEDLD